MYSLPSAAWKHTRTGRKPLFQSAHISFVHPTQHFLALPSEWDAIWLHVAQLWFHISLWAIRREPQHPDLKRTSNEPGPATPIYKLRNKLFSSTQWKANYAKQRMEKNYYCSQWLHPIRQKYLSQRIFWGKAWDPQRNAKLYTTSGKRNAWRPICSSKLALEENCSLSSQ